MDKTSNDIIAGNGREGFINAIEFIVIIFEGFRTIKICFDLGSHRGIGLAAFVTLK